MDCGEMALSEEFGEVIFEYNVELERLFEDSPDVCMTKLDGRFAVGYYRRSSYGRAMRSTGFHTVPKLYAPMDQSAPEAMGALWGFRQPTLDLRGRGVLIGIIDSGIDLMNPVFTDETGRPRIIGLWDQTDESGEPPEDFGYGSMYDQEQIETLIQQKKQNPDLELPGRDETGHGTFLAGVAAGRQDPAADFTGTAPEALIAVVKLKPAKQYLRDFFFVREGAECYQENDIMAAVRYLSTVQFRAYRPMVICVGMGTNMGGHSGNTFLALMLDRFTMNWGCFCVVPTGNEANASHHFQGSLNPAVGRERVEIRVPENSRGFSLELWSGTSERYQVGIRSPGGESVPAGIRGIASSNTYDFYREGTRVYVDYSLSGTRAEGQLIFLRFENPAPGIWEIEVEGHTVIRGNYNMWLPVSEFVEEGTVFLRPSPDITLTDPGAAERLITTAGYNHRNGGIFLDSGRGYTRLDRIKPDVAAPAVQVYGPLPGGRFGTRSGTSIGAALTAGICADLLEWGVVRGKDPFLNQVRLKDYLIRGAERMPDRNYPNREWGYGIVSLEGTFRALQG